jgi:hypothetical protein
MDEVSSVLIFLHLAVQNTMFRTGRPSGDPGRAAAGVTGNRLNEHSFIHFFSVNPLRLWKNGRLNEEL